MARAPVGLSSAVKEFLSAFLQAYDTDRTLLETVYAPDAAFSLELLDSEAESFSRALRSYDFSTYRDAACRFRDGPQGPVLSAIGALPTSQHCWQLLVVEVSVLDDQELVSAHVSGSFEDSAQHTLLNFQRTLFLRPAPISTWRSGWLFNVTLDRLCIDAASTVLEPPEGALLAPAQSARAVMRAGPCALSLALSALHLAAGDVQLACRSVQLTLREATVAASTSCIPRPITQACRPALRRPHALDGRLLAALRVHEPPALIRVGPEGDGGYLIVPSKASYDGFMSGGVGDNVDFEIDLLELCPDLSCLAFDHTVPTLPKSHPRLVWRKEPLDAKALSQYLEPRNEVFFKCDIEGAEWPTLLGVLGLLSRVRQLVLELHGVGDESYPWTSHAAPVEMQVAVLEALAETHWLVHAHGNNWSPAVPIDTATVPEILELTYVRKDTVLGALPRHTGGLPRNLDAPNTAYIDHTLSGHPWDDDTE